MGSYRAVGIENLWEKEDLKETKPPGEFTFKELKTLETTLTSTGWLKKSLMLRGIAYSTSSQERLTLNTGFSTEKATNKKADPSQRDNA